MWGAKQGAEVVDDLGTFVQVKTSNGLFYIDKSKVLHVGNKGASVSVAPVSAVTPAFVGPTPSSRLDQFKSKFPGMKPSIVEKLAKVNDGSNKDVINVPLAASASDIEAVKAAFPGKTLKKVNANKWVQHDKVADATSPAEKKATIAAKIQSGTMTESDWKAKATFDATPQANGSYKSTYEHQSAAYYAEYSKWKSSLKSAEKSAIRQYSNGAYQMLRKVESGKIKDPKYEKMAEHLKSALDKAPPAVGAKLYRGMHLPKDHELLTRLSSVGSTFELEAHTSSSTSWSVAKGFSVTQNKERVGVLISIKSNKTGVSISALSHYKEESEVLLRKGAKYKIVGHKIENGHHHVEVEEHD